ncbi:recombinase family protein [Nocardia sp. CS682]|uniref:recombinase family protein n=1 Tax=Nocardia sp. CS682 TaxID=1047172 RepID=UPI001431E584|nr:recombinase family protein [Nocardia sp. CS682]
MKAAVYLRQSQDRAGDELGIDRQRRDVMRLVSQRGWTVHFEYVDNDTSASSRKRRPHFEAMLEAVERGEVDVIVARHVDRLLRRLAELERVLDLCEKHGAYVVTASDGVDTSTDGGRLVARILAAVGQGEVERKGARQRSAAQQAAAQGRWIGGRRAFGYEPDGMTIREDEARLIRQAYDDIVTGASAGFVARQWNSQGSSTPQGRRDGSPKPWNHENVRTVLVNPRYAGLRRHRTAEQRADTRKNPTLGIAGVAQWPAIVSEEKWRAAVAILSDPTRMKAPTGPRLLLSGLAKCGVCGETVHAGSRSRRLSTYRCRSGRHVSRRAEPIDQFVEDVTLARLLQPDALELFSPKVHNDVAPLVLEAQVVRDRLGTVADEFADGSVSADQLRRITERLNGRLATLEAQIAEAGRADVIAPIVHSADIAATWAGLETHQKRGIIDSLMVVTIELIGPGRRPDGSYFAADGVRVDWRG